MTGWVPPSTAGVPGSTPPGGSGPVVGWQSPTDPEGLGVRESIAAGWHMTRANLGPLAAIAVIPELLRNLLLLPLWVLYAGIFAKEIDFFRTLDYRRYTTDPEGVRRDMDAIFHVSGDQAAIVAISGGLSIFVMIVGFGAITAGTLAASNGIRPSVGGAWRAVATRVSSLVLPAAAIGALWALITGPLFLGGTFNAGADTDPGRTAIGALLSLASVVVGIAVLFLIVRWALIFQVVLADGRGLPRSLNESARLSAGARTRIGLALIALWFIVGFVGGLIALVGGVVGWLVTQSMEGAAVGYTVTLAICGLVYMPWIAAVLTHVYVVRKDAVPAETSPVATA